MTIQTGLLHDGQAYLWSDTAHWNANTGQRALIAAKVYQGGLWDWAAAISGDSHGVMDHLMKLPNLTPEALTRDIQGALRAEAAAGRIHRVLYGWHDERHGAQLRFVMSEAAPGYEPYTDVSVAHYLCWGNGARWFEPFAAKSLTPTDMREVVRLQMDNYDFPALADTALIDRPRSDMIETVIGSDGISHRQYRLDHADKWEEVPLGSGFGAA